MIPPVVLLTDFGTSDPYAGLMKGVICTITPGAQVIDLTHEISPYDIRRGAFVLLASYAYFPEKTIFVGVVDPGVGGSRRPVCLCCGGRYFLGPDNGLFSWVAQKEGVDAAFILEKSDWFLDNVSKTFHGRDIFAPVAAHLARGVSMSDLGPACDPKSLESIPFPTPVIVPGVKIDAEVLVSDRFGNLVTSIREQDLRACFGKAYENSVVIIVSGSSVKGLSDSYASVGKGMPLAIIGSSGFLELSVNMGDASEFFSAAPGTRVQVALQ